MILKTTAAKTERKKTAQTRARGAKSVAHKSAASKLTASRPATSTRAAARTEGGKTQATVVKKLLKNMEQKLSGKDVKASLGDYFPNNGAGTNFSGMPFYDAWNTAQFLAEYGAAMSVITTNTVSPSSYPNEVAFLPTVLGNFTTAIMSYVRGSQPSCRFEVLYPTDVNQSAFNQAINYPSSWTAAALNVTEDRIDRFHLGA